MYNYNHVKRSISFKKQEIQNDNSMREFYKYIKKLAKEVGIEDIRIRFKSCHVIFHKNLTETVSYLQLFKASYGQIVILNFI